MAAPSPAKSKTVTGPALVPMGHHEGKAPIRLTRPVYVIGSRSSARIHLISNTVSKAHALLIRSNGRTFIRDLASRSKVYVNGDEVREAVLEHDDLIKIGTFTFQYLGGPGEGSKSIDAVKAPPAKLEVSGVDFPVVIEQRVMLIGRRSSCDINLLEESVSTAHAVIFEIDGQRFIRDLGSRQGTFVNEVSTHQHQLAPDDVIGIGDSTLKYLPNEITGATVVEEEAALDLSVPVVDEIPQATEPAIEEPLAVAEETAEPEMPVIPVEAEAEAPIAPVSEVDSSAIPLDVEDLAAIAPEPEPQVEAIPVTPRQEAVAEPELPPLAVEEEPAIPVEAEAPIDVEQELEIPAAAEAEQEAAPLAQEDIDLTPLAADDLPEIPVEDVEPVAQAPVELSTASATILPPPPLAPLTEEMELLAEPGEPVVPSMHEVSATLDLSVHPHDPFATPSPAAEALELPTPEELPPPPIESPALDLAEVEAPEAPAIEEPPAIELPTVQETQEAPAPTPEIELPEPAAADVPPPPLEPVEEAIALDTPAIDDEPAIPVIEPEAIEPEPIDVVGQTESTQPDLESAAADALAMDVLAETDEPAAQDVAAPESESVEVIDRTEPTPQSALESAADELAMDALSGTDVPMPMPKADELTDTTFGREVREFTGNEIGELVEEPVAEPTPAAEISEPELIEPETPALQASSEEIPVVEEFLDEPTPAVEASEPELIEPELPAVESAAEPAIPELELPPAEPADVAPVAEAPKPTPAPLPPPQQRPRVPWGAANAENFLGGVPISLRQPPRPQPPEPPHTEETVKGLIKEIDSVAARAEAAAAAPPPPPAPPTTENEAPPPPLPAKQPPRPFRAAAQRPVRKPPNLLTPTEQKEKPARNVVQTGFDGLAMSPLRDMDVFAQSSPDTADEEEVLDLTEEPPAPAPNTDAPPRRRGPASVKLDPPAATNIAAELGGDTEAESPDTASRLRVTPTLPNTVDGQVASNQAPPVAYVADLNEAQAVSARKRYKRRVTAMLCAMVLLLVASSWAIYTYLGATTSIQGTITYKNLGSLSMIDQDVEHKEIMKVLNDDATRRAALIKLHERPELAEGFLGDTVSYIKVVERGSFTQDKPDASLMLKVVGRDPKGDAARLSAVLATLYELNRNMADNARKLRRDEEEAMNIVAQSQRDIARHNDGIEALRTLDAARPSPQQIAAIEGDLAKLEQVWSEAVATVKSADVELTRLKSAPAGTSNNPAAPAPAPANDEKLKNLQASLTELNTKANDAAASTNRQSVDAKRALDMALDSFQKQIADTQGMLNGNPELASYVSAAQKLHETTRQLTDDLIRRQEAQFSRLTELKQRLNDRLEKQRAQAWEGDKQLRDLAEQETLLTRQHNAALAGGMQEAVAETKTQLELVRNMIKARQDLMAPGDPFYAEAIQQLQLIIDSTKKDIESDRTRTEQWLTSLQRTFISGQSIEKLPQEQKELATRIQQRLESINSARKEYNQALDASASDSDSQLKSQVVTLQAAIDARRSELAAQNLQSLQNQQEQTRLAAIQAKQTELTRLKESEAAASAAYFAKHREWRSAQAKQNESNDNARKLDELLRAKDQAEKNFRATRDQLEIKKLAAARAVEPYKPAEVSAREGDDRRLMYILINGGSILLVFVVMILWTLHTAAIHAPVHSIQATDLRPVEPPPAAPAAKNAQDEDEDHEPAIV